MKNAGIRARCWLGRIQGALQLVTWQWLTAATDARCENAPKVDIKRPFEIRIVAKFSTFYGKYGHFPHRFTHFFVVTDVYALFDIPSEKSAHNFIKTRGGRGVNGRL